MATTGLGELDSEQKLGGAELSDSPQEATVDGEEGNLD